VEHLLVTGGAGFIGSHLVDRLLAAGKQVTVVDNFDSFYDPEMKEENVRAHHDYAGYRLVRADIRDLEGLRRELREDFDLIIHLAARAGVRPSIEQPLLYQEVNIRGTQNMLELARERRVERFIFASSSSVYGVNPRVPWSEDDQVLQPISPYAGTKVSGELLGHVYHHLYGISFIALRFFTVYGPRQRPDLAIHKFARLLLAGKPLPVYGSGETKRDYTYIDDVVRGIVAATRLPAGRYELINLGNNRTVTLKELIYCLEEVFGVKARLRYLPEQPGDVPQTCADIKKAAAFLGYRPETPLRTGLEEFACWLEKHLAIQRVG
jgi:UDP-glucuronate 4-epimerase